MTMVSTPAWRSRIAAVWRSVCADTTLDASVGHDAVGVRITSLPITAEKVRQALREKQAVGGVG